MPSSRPNSASNMSRGESSGTLSSIPSRASNDGRDGRTPQTRQSNMNRGESSGTLSSTPSRASSDGRDGRTPQTRQSPPTSNQPSTRTLSSAASDDSGFSINPNRHIAPTRGSSRAKGSSHRTSQHEMLHIFDSRGHALSEAEKREMWRAEGKCGSCGEITTHKIKKYGPLGILYRNEALTVAGQVYKGHCLNCRNLESVRRDLGEISFTSSDASKPENSMTMGSRDSMRLSSIDEVGDVSTIEAQLVEATSRESEERTSMLTGKKILAKRWTLICMVIALIIISGIIGGTVWCVIYFLEQRQVSKGGVESVVTVPDDSPKGGVDSPSSPASPDLPPTSSSIKKGWVQVGSDVLPPPLSANSNHHIEQHFGRAVSMSANGRRVAVGTPETYGKGDLNGLVVVYELSSKTNEWKVMGDAIWGKKSKDQTGASVSLDADGTRLAVGSLGDDTGDGGFVSVYKYKGGNVGWTLLGEPIKSSRRGDQFAFSVSLSGDGTTVAVGAPEIGIDQNNVGEIGGSVHIYQYDADKRKWIRMGNVLRGERSIASVINNDIDDRFGNSVSLSFYGNNIVVGAPYANNRGGVRAGYAYVYDYKKGDRGKMDWELSREQRGSAAGDWAGWSVSMNYLGDFFVFGSKNANRVNQRNGMKVENAGSVETNFFDLEASEWYLFSFPINGQNKQEYLGASVALSGNSFTMAVTSETSKNGNSAGLGHVSVYKRYEYDSSHWFPAGEEIVGDGNFDEIGTSHAIALSEHGQYIVIGSEGKRDDISGRARVYEILGS